MWILLNKLNKTTTLTKPPNRFDAAYCDARHPSISDDYLQIPAEILFPFKRPKSAH